MVSWKPIENYFCLSRWQWFFSSKSTSKLFCNALKQHRLENEYRLRLYLNRLTKAELLEKAQQLKVVNSLTGNIWSVIKYVQYIDRKCMFSMSLSTTTSISFQSLKRVERTQRLLWTETSVYSYIPIYIFLI